MDLVIDIGNSNIVTGLFFNGQWIHKWRMETILPGGPETYEQEFADLFRQNGIHTRKIQSCTISSVVPALHATIDSLLKNFIPVTPLWLTSTIYPNLSLEIDDPNEIGTDLVANSVAAFELFGKDAIIADFGTALTFTTVTSKAQVLGVSIVPGLKTAIKALAGNAAQLDEVPLQYPKSAIGKNTISAIQSGILVGYVGLVKEMLRQIRAETGAHCIAIATGGLSEILDPLSDSFDHIVPNLTIEGIRRIGLAVR